MIVVEWLLLGQSHDDHMQSQLDHKLSMAIQILHCLTNLKHWMQKKASRNVFCRLAQGACKVFVPKYHGGRCTWSTHGYGATYTSSHIVSCSFLYPSTLHTFQAETQSEPLHPRSIRRSICFTSNTRTLGPTSARAREKLCIPSKGSKIILWNHSICREILMETWHCPANPAASSSFSNGR